VLPGYLSSYRITYLLFIYPNGMPHTYDGPNCQVPVFLVSFEHYYYFPLRSALFGQGSSWALSNLVTSPSRKVLTDVRQIAGAWLLCFRYRRPSRLPLFILPYGLYDVVDP